MCEICALPECDNEVLTDSFYVIGLHQYACSKECLNVILTETFFSLKERNNGETDSGVQQVPPTKEDD